MTKIRAKIDNVIILSRWKEYFFMIVLMTLLPAIMGTVAVDWKLTVLFLANLCGYAFAFMINEVEDAEDDKKDKNRTLTNPVALNKMKYGTGWWVAIGTGVVSVGLYALLGWWVYIIGIINFGLSLGYSWKRIRLKSMPVLDIVSHGLTLGGLQYLAGFLVFEGDLRLGALMVAFTISMSMVGQLSNQIRDFKADREARLNNTSGLIGLEWAKIVRWVLLLAGIVFGLGIVVARVIPVAVMATILGLIVVLKFFGLSNFKTGREAKADLESQKLMIDTVLAINLAVIGWFVVETRIDRQVLMLAKIGAYELMKIPGGEWLGEVMVRWI